MDQPDAAKNNNTPLRIVAAIAAYNEERYIGSVILKARKHATEVIVFDDGSVDATSEVARLAGATVLRNNTNRGKGAAMRELLASAKNKSPDVLVFLDADGQHDPNEIPRLVDAVREGYDLVVGSRTAEKKKTPFYRRVGQSVLSHAASVASRGKKGERLRKRISRSLPENDCGNPTH